LNEKYNQTPKTVAEFFLSGFSIGCGGLMLDFGFVMLANAERQGCPIMTFIV
jgi:hypothetical protein